ncbi:ABC transporter ATP-binding protein [Pannonibacter carbonis]|uniref:ABC transporter ATP-binding protein n=1 Tax=Pannonibacter carbonis TaxID=2067569 RepID=UPI000D0F31CD|nr:ABC transporter ATP-binding protein [Pannonibacter carbonis]
MGTEALSLEGVSIRLGKTLVLDRISLEVPAGSFTCLLGPSGCGKTTLLRSIAGFAPLAAGDIKVGGNSIATLAPEARQTAMVFQSYALWPHMSVAGNLTYPLKLRGLPKAEREKRANAILSLLGLEGYGPRAVTSLSGGQRQRVALGRALIIDPPLLLLDEPLSNLDASIRRSLRGELRRLQQKVGITTIMVTHDQDEALAMADRIVLMRDGQIVQVAGPEDLYSAPADLGAAQFLGVDNVLAVAPDDPAAQGATLVGFRTEDARVFTDDMEHPDAPALARKGKVTTCAYAGGGYQVGIDVAGESLSACSARPVSPGDDALLSVPASMLMSFDANTRLLQGIRH